MHWAEPQAAEISTVATGIAWLRRECGAAWTPFWRADDHGPRIDTGPRPTVPLRSGYFRQISCFAFVFLLVTLGSIIWGEHLLEEVLIGHVKEMLTTESRAYPMLERYGDASQLARTFSSRDAAAPRRERVAAVQTADGVLLHGSADLLSPTLCGGTSCQGWLRARQTDADGIQREWLGHATRLADGGRYVVAYDILPMLDRTNPVPLAGGAAVFVVLLVSLGVALCFSVDTARHIDRIRQAMARFGRGELDARVPLRRSMDEFDQLGRDVNQALTRINLLMEEVRNATNHIAHELRTPLTRLQQRLSDIAEAASGDPTVCAELALAEEESQRIQQLFRAVMRISEIETGRCHRDDSSIDIAALLADLRDYYECLADERGMTLQIRVDAPRTLRGDRALLFQALVNLLDNALKYAPAASTVTLLARRCDGGVALGVADQGPGIAPDQRALAVQRFQRLERDSGNAGHGLGLTLVQAVAGLHHGQLILSDNDLPAHTAEAVSRRGLLALLRLPANTPIESPPI